jgi:hypothetical protein
MNDSRSMPEFNGAHYTRSVMELSDILTVTTSKPIYSKTGLRLVAEDVEINSAFFKRMLQHSMSPPFEQCLVVANGIAHDDIVGMAQQLLQSDAKLSRMAKSQAEQDALLQPLKEIVLAPAVHFLLTLARERRTHMLEHAIMVALVSIYLGIRMGQSGQKLVDLATAGLLHDIGEMRFNPQLFDSNYRLSSEERQQIHQHPQMSHNILQAAAAYSANTLAAVLQHHERQDGSGYPAGLSGEGISRAGQILALAEVASNKVCQGLWGALRLEMICKLNTQQFATPLLGYLSALYGHDSQKLPMNGSKAARIGMQKIQGQINKIALVFNTWRDAQGKAPGKPQSAFAFIQQRLSSLHVALQDAGIDPDGKQFLNGDVEQDLMAMAELDQLTLEVIWQLRETLLSVQHRWPKFAADKSAQGVAVAGWIEAMEELLNAGGRLF